MWEQPSAEFNLTLINQANKARSKRITGTFNGGSAAPIHIERGLAAKASGWLVSDTLVVEVDVSAQCESKFLLRTGCVPCNVVLKLPCGSEVQVVGLVLQLASPFFCNVLEDVKGSSKIPVDGSLGTWAYILSDCYPQCTPPALTLGNVFMLLPVVHKYNFPYLLTRLMAITKEQSGALSHDPAVLATFVIRWLDLAERLQLDELRQLCMDRLQGMTREERKMAITVEVDVEGSLGTWTYILSHIYSQCTPPALTLGSVCILLPVVHMYKFVDLQTWLLVFVKENSGALSQDPATPNTHVVQWFHLAERLGLLELREVCLDRMQGMMPEGWWMGIPVEVSVAAPRWHC
ncbi:hypothetical protein FOA52_006522 [Chlamydomonas sp. UWO 241]|nr:hypothetical protein FOA52_006522 [Chlamydomonas sp. UWO 241]